MLKIFKKLTSPKHKTLRTRLLFTLMISTIYLVGKGIPVPGTVPLTQNAGGVFDLLNMLSGNALSTFSIFALGVGPYITASIVVQLLSMDVLPVLTRYAQEGETGRKMLNQITRYLAIVLAVIQAFSFALYFDNTHNALVDPGAKSYAIVVLTLTAGTAFVLWLGDQITQRGIGNGISFIIMIGIVSGMPNTFKTAFDALYVDGNLQTQLLSISKFAVFVLFSLLIIILVIFVQEGVRRVGIHYSNRSNNSYGGVGRNFIPFKVNSAGVIPVIFASAILGSPLIIVSLASYWVKSDSISAASDWINTYLNQSTPTGFMLYLVLIVAFSYFYTFIQVDPKKMSENLQQSGAYIPGVRPGEETSDFVSKILYRLTFFGSIFLAFISGIPLLIGALTNLPPSVTIGGTSLLIVVSVGLESIRQIEEQLVSSDYEGYTTK